MTVKETRRYDASGRRARAAQSAAHVVATAGRLFSEQGYEGTTIAAIAEQAGVSPATIYSQFGNKPTLLGKWLESVTADRADRKTSEQDWFVELEQASDFEAGLRAVVTGVGGILERVHTPFAIAREAGRSDPAVKALYREMSDLRHQVLRVIASELSSLAPEPPGDGVDTLADSLWVLVSPSLYEGLVVDRSWTHERYEQQLFTMIRALFGVPAPGSRN